MADVITRFKLETTQYDSKLRDAAKGLKDIVHQAELGGKGFKDFSQKSIDAARSLGTVASGAATAKDKVKDLVGAYNEAAKAYNNLTKEQQQSDFGKAMSQSLTQLSARIREAKSELYGLDKAIKDVHSNGGLFGENGLTGILQVAGGNLLAQGVAALGSELTDTINQSIDLARQAEGIHIAFDRLNRPGLLANLKEATHGTVSELELMKAAVKFDDFNLPVEELGTLLAFAQKKAKDTGQSVDYMVDSIVTGLGRKSLMILDNLGLSAAQIKERMAEGGDMTKAVADIIKEQMTEAGEYVETAADRAARAAADAQNQMEELGRQAMPVAEEWATAWNEIKLGGMEVLTTVLGPITDSIRSIREILSGEFELKIKGNIPNLADGPVSPWAGRKPGTDHTVQAPGGYVEITDKNTGAVIGGRHFDNLQDTNSINTWQKSLTKTTKGGKSTSSLPSMGDFDKALGKSLLDTDKLKEGKEMLSPYQMMLPEIEKSILKIKDADLGGELAKWGDKKVADEIAAITTRIEQQQKATELAAQAAQNFGAALAGLDDPATKAAGTVMQAIANIALSFSMAAAQASSLGPYGWIAYMAAGAGALATTISTIHSLTGFQNGGMIKGYSTGGTIQGNSYSGDNIGGIVDGSQLVGLNAGELVLNKAQQATLAQNLQGNGGGGMRVVGEIQGEKIVLVANRYFKRTGQGEIVTW